MYKPYDPKLTCVASVSTYCLGPVIYHGCHLCLVLQIQMGYMVTQLNHCPYVDKHCRSACYSVGPSCLCHPQTMVKQQLTIPRSRLFLQVHKVREICKFKNFS